MPNARAIYNPIPTPLKFLATQAGRTKAYYLRQIIEQGIEDLEDYYLAAEVVERIRQGQEQVHSAADVRKDFVVKIGNRREVYRK